MGLGDELESQNIRLISYLLRSSYELSLPVFADIRPVGSGVSDINFEDFIKLGVSFIMEAGTDALIIPNCGSETLKLIGNWSTIPVIVRIENLLNFDEAKHFFDLRLAGI